MPNLPLYDKLREKELNRLLEDLCKKVYSGDEIEEFAKQFIELYSVNGGVFHAPYGVISGCITGLFTKHGKDYVDLIPHNLNGIATILKDMVEREGSKSSKVAQYTQAYKSLIDLQDYVSMEAIRVDQIARQFEKATEQANIVLDEAKKLNDETLELHNNSLELRESINQVNSDATSTLTEAKQISSDAKNLKTEVVSILAIFAAIILTFSGGLTILGEAVATIKDTPLHSLLLVIVFCIWGLFNTIYLLLCVVSRLSDRNLSADCKKGSCTECTDKEKCKGLCRFIRRSPYVVGFNVFLIIMCAIIILLNYLGILE